MTYTEKLDHFHEVQQSAARHATKRAHIDEVAAGYAEWDRTLKPPKQEDARRSV